MQRFIGLALSGCLLAGASLAGASAMAAQTFFTQTSAQTPITTTDGTPTTIVTITVPAGNWLAWGKAEVVDFADQTVARCHLYLNGTEIDSSASQIGGGNHYPFVAVIPNHAAFTATDASTVVLGCSEDGEISGLYVDPDASLIVMSASGKIH
jgi:hypothetical protein